jgi:ATP-dependent DNA helicase RecQ
MQREIIEAVLQGKDVLAIMPTGGGKSVCFQVPAMVLPGTTIVVSPLIALMKDQVEALRLNGIKADYLNSTLSSREQNEVERRCISGEIKLLYVSPEKLASDSFQWLKQRMQVNLFAIDEAHCISFWGHDFRPEYTQMSMLKDNYPETPVIALTATADKLTRKDIVEQLRLPNPEVFIASFDRPNLSLNVQPGIKRLQKIIAFLDTHPDQPGIIYCLSRKSTEDLADKLRIQGFKAEAYNAGLPAERRSRVQDSFLKDDIQIICATIAFGMGIDKSNVRWIIHYNLPKNIESYYQEIGRAGRDGAPAETLLLYAASDAGMQKMHLLELPEQQRELQEAKLERLQQYAEAVFCRRKVLLSYFNEDYNKDCGNCDNCRRPPRMIDGTLIAQKALSALARMKEQGTLVQLIDVLRGVRTQAIVQKQFHEIKTFGLGKDVRSDDWRGYLQQMINLGLMEVAYDDNHHLKLNEKSKRVLFENEKVELVQPQAYQAQRVEAFEFTKSKREIFEDELFEKLRKLRKDIADMEGLPPYVIFNDNTLKEMAKYRPSTRTAMMEISGVGNNKFDAYGQSFIDEIIKFVNGKTSEGNKLKGATHLETWALLQKGFQPEDIAKQRNMNVTTIYSHIGTLYEGGHPVDLKQYVSDKELQAIQAAIKDLGMQARLKEIFDKLEGQYEYHKIRLALAYYAKHRK